ncbi:hypothetical protein HPB48_015852 [Haemaphysalis longicornis]|uniref:Uncharacterized protein n=1 Tax=Haemaphysalis longicornis TaxID=44386 RepID=A0A9J6GSS3_HAELO|nr:hypothetical protein HPB48_015852 [Haemaphysalis longicornis]
MGCLGVLQQPRDTVVLVIYQGSLYNAWKVASLTPPFASAADIARPLPPAHPQRPTLVCLAASSRFCIL